MNNFRRINYKGLNFILYSLNDMTMYDHNIQRSAGNGLRELCAYCRMHNIKIFTVITGPKTPYVILCRLISNLILTKENVMASNLEIYTILSGILGYSDKEILRMHGAFMGSSLNCLQESLKIIKMQSAET